MYVSKIYFTIVEFWKKKTAAKEVVQESVNEDNVDSHLLKRVTQVMKQGLADM